MLPVVVFDLRGSMAHFRRPDTLSTHATYPIITRTALRGLIASILGISPTEESDGLSAEFHVGVRLMRPVMTVAQQLSMHGKKWIGKGTNDNFHRPTSIEIVVEPHYRVFCAGPESNELSLRLQAKQTEYHTYLGSAFCLTFPEWIGDEDGTEVTLAGSAVHCESVVPTTAIKKLVFENGLHYSRVSGMLHRHIGGRRFRGSINVIYEAAGKKVVFEPEKKLPQDLQFVTLGNGETVCLW